MSFSVYLSSLVFFFSIFSHCTSLYFSCSFSLCTTHHYRPRKRISTHFRDSLDALSSFVTSYSFFQSAGTLETHIYIYFFFRYSFFIFTFIVRGFDGYSFHFNFVCNYYLLDFFSFSSIIIFISAKKKKKIKELR